jgi:hypothetical protein
MVVSLQYQICTFIGRSADTEILYAEFIEQDPQQMLMIRIDPSVHVQIILWTHPKIREIIFQSVGDTITRYADDVQDTILAIRSRDPFIRILIQPKLNADMLNNTCIEMNSMSDIEGIVQLQETLENFCRRLDGNVEVTFPTNPITIKPDHLKALMSKPTIPHLRTVIWLRDNKLDEMVRTQNALNECGALCLLELCILYNGKNHTINPFSFMRELRNGLQVDKLLISPTQKSQSDTYVYDPWTYRDLLHGTQSAVELQIKSKHTYSGTPRNSLEDMCRTLSITHITIVSVEEVSRALISEILCVSDLFDVQMHVPSDHVALESLMIKPLRYISIEGGGVLALTDRVGRIDELSFRLIDNSVDAKHEWCVNLLLCRLLAKKCPHLRSITLDITMDWARTLKPEVYSEFSVIFQIPTLQSINIAFGSLEFHSGMLPVSPECQLLKTFRISCWIRHDSIENYNLLSFLSMNCPLLESIWIQTAITKQKFTQNDNAITGLLIRNCRYLRELCIDGFKISDNLFSELCGFACGSLTLERFVFTHAVGMIHENSYITLERKMIDNRRRRELFEVSCSLLSINRMFDKKVLYDINVLKIVCQMMWAKRPYSLCR